jgi:predicted enzyme related to lactoylglutathione lyase/uncharacterized protein YciI
MNKFITWVEIPATDLARAEKFYGGLFGIRFFPLSVAGVEYSVFDFPGNNNSCALAKGEGYVPSATGTLLYLNGAPDMALILERVPELGGKVLVDKFYAGMEAGYLAYILDSEGNKIGLQHYDYKDKDDDMKFPSLDYVPEHLIGHLVNMKHLLTLLYRKGENYNAVTRPRIIKYDHLRYLFAYRDKGTVTLSMPVMDDDSDIREILLFSTDKIEEVKAIADDDPAVKTKVYKYEILNTMGMVGDSIK